MNQQSDFAKQLDQIIFAIATLQKENRQLRADLLNAPTTGWVDPLRAGVALGFSGKDVTIVKKMHQLRKTGAFNKYGTHYRTIGADYQYHIENCNKALNKGKAA
ncbi:hypothetical protein N836_31790 [Leptolyngbya sp. Heron Island J]|uniref:hypothetical protein n=1 Tax=Leptolyngbya sp. Heron Island J TaxID=1385935 RepID=UPI0003B98CB7|nr:hypothetical protein [Leptolyngbya sp. Heron Island J]ESA38523.1 hypothetical protein N836_31790 [Leptolyngbya sp. Heron Island J]